MFEVLTSEEKSKINGSQKAIIKMYQIPPGDVYIPPTLTDSEILCAEYAEPEFIVPGLIPEGLTVLAGKPKVGKSMISLDIAMSIAMGGRALGAIDVNKEEVLYLTLEDSNRRLKTRLSLMLQNYPATNLFHSALSWPRMDKGFLPILENWLQAHPNTKLIIIDTFTKIRGLKRAGSTLYEKDYNEVTALKAFADEKKISIVLVHHLRKSSATDIMDLVSGSVGVTGAADTILIMTRQRGEGIASLFITGRDVEERSLSLKFDSANLTWTISATAIEDALGQEKKAIFGILQNAEGPLRLGQVAEAIGKKKPVVHKHLAALIDEGLVKQPAYGVYEVVVESNKSHESGETSETSANMLQ